MAWVIPVVVSEDKDLQLYTLGILGARGMRNPGGRYARSIGYEGQTLCYRGRLTGRLSLSHPFLRSFRCAYQRSTFGQGATLRSVDP